MGDDRSEKVTVAQFAEIILRATEEHEAAGRDVGATPFLKGVLAVIAMGVDDPDPDMGLTAFAYTPDDRMPTGPMAPEVIAAFDRADEVMCRPWREIREELKAAHPEDSDD